MSMLKKRYGFSVEDLQEELGESGDEGIVPGSDDQLIDFDESDMHEKDDSDVIEEAMDQVADVSEGLEAIQETMLAALSDGGMTKQSSLFATLAIQGIVGKWMDTDSVMPGMESFDDADGRMTATGYALEGIGEMLSNLWKRIKAFIKKWYKAACAFLQRMSFTAKGYAASAEKLIKLAKAKKGHKPKDATLEIAKGIANELSISGTFDPEKATEAAITLLKKSAGQAKGTSDMVADVIEVFSKLDLAVDADVADAAHLASGASFKSAVAGMGAGKKTASGDSFKATADTAYFEVNPGMPGSSVCIMELNGKKDVFVGMRVTAVHFKKWDHLDAVDQKASDISGVVRLATDAKNVFNAIVDADKNADAMQKSADKAINKMDRLSAEADKIKGKGNKAASAAIRSMISASGGSLTSALQIDAITNRQAFATGKAAYAVAKQHYNNLTKD